MSADGWKDGLGQDGVADYAQYIATMAQAFVAAFLDKGFSREEAIRITLAILPAGFRPK